MSAMSPWFLTAVFAAMFGPVAVQAAADVTAPAGRVVGLEQDVDGTTVNMFLGIPFAQPPVGARRFRRAEPLQPWDGVYNATRKPNACIQLATTLGSAVVPDLQINTPLSEDCLYLNVWQPTPLPTAAAVMVWIYGGSFQSGSSALDLYDGRYLAATEGVLVVSVNYRLSTLGFAYSGTDAAPGNMGLTDQVLALQWVQDNIASFGGDPAKVTVFGESAGGMSAGFLLMSPESRGLFNRAIMQSGTAVLNPLVYPRPADGAYDSTKALAGSLGCTTEEGPAAMMNCLREKDAESLVASSPPIYPVIDGTFISDNPEKALIDGEFEHMDILLGTNSDEGMLFFILFGLPGYTVGSETSITRDQFKQNVRAMTIGLNDLAVEAVAFQYTDWRRPDDSDMYRDALDTVLTDWSFVCPAFRTARAHTRVGRTAYMYDFVHRPSNSLAPDWAGTLHTDEIQFVFGRPLNAAMGYTAEEVDLSRRMMRYWANFAKTGNPNNNGEVAWSPYTESSRGVLMLDTDAPRMVTGQKARECALWENYVPTLLNNTAMAEEPEQCVAVAESSSAALWGQSLTVVLLLNFIKDIISFITAAIFVVL
ncbi:PREDICTED: cholinesterase 1-like [Branchiostoma belcheri]|uniref:Carboxylic ester hydrolase n=1 Tax=Branchiostoma belcheri TaxID=7741 RepID=A0A6P4XUR3_BRABE|nr:PREDICTED: cholinesterase 1-like [Branchiostoma belcheri]